MKKEDIIPDCDGYARAVTGGLEPHLPGREVTVTPSAHSYGVFSMHAQYPSIGSSPTNFVSRMKAKEADC